MKDTLEVASKGNCCGIWGGTDGRDGAIVERGVERELKWSPEERPNVKVVFCQKLGCKIRADVFKSYAEARDGVIK